MKVKVLILLGLLFLQNHVIAADKFSICTTGGYYSGAENKFLSELAHYMANKKNVLTDPECAANWKVGERVARKLTDSGKLTTDFEHAIFKQAIEFSDRVYSKISNGIDLDEQKSE